MSDESGTTLLGDQFRWPSRDAWEGMGHGS